MVVRVYFVARACLGGVATRVYDRPRTVTHSREQPLTGRFLILGLLSFVVFRETTDWDELDDYLWSSRNQRVYGGHAWYDPPNAKNKRNGVRQRRRTLEGRTKRRTEC